MRRFVRIALTLLVLGYVSAATEVRAQVLTFDEMHPTVSQSPILGTVVCSTGTGFRFSSDHFHVIDENYGAIFSHGGSTHLGYESSRGFPIRLEREGTGTFSLLSLDAGEFYSAPDPDRPDAERIVLTGYQANGNIVTHTLVLDGIRDGSGGVPDFQHFVLPNTFVNLRAVVFTGLRQGDQDGGLAFDNLEYQLNPSESLPLCDFFVLPSDIPTVSFVSPSAGVVTGSVSIQANATDNTAVANVVFKLDGVDLAPPDTTAPYSLQWDTTMWPDGAYTLSAEARDAANNVGTASLPITIQNGIVIGQGPHYLVFDGMDDYVVVGDTPAASFGNGTVDTPFTMEMWLRPDTVSVHHQLIGKAGEYRVAFVYGTLMVDLRDESAGALAEVLTTDNLSTLVGGWHHVAVTYDGRGGSSAANGVTIYIDGVAVNVLRFTDSGYVAMENLTQPLTIGRANDGSSPFDGGIDEVRLWNLARTAGAIQSAMTVELVGNEAGLVAYWRFDEGVGFSAADDSPGTATGALVAGTQWAADGPLAPDTTAPQISGVTVSNVTSSTATITFSTDETATGWVSYVAGPACPCTDVFGAPGTTHSITLTGLSANTQYRFVVHARDAANNERATTAQTFQTLVPAPDTQAPVVSFAAPAAGAVAGNTLVQASATDNVAVVSVQFKLDGVALGSPITAAPYTLNWNTTTASEGAHTLSVEARDAANNLGTASVAVTVMNVTTPHYLAFDGVDDSVRIADAPALSFGNGTTDSPFAVEMWVRPDSVSSRHQLLGKAGEYRVAILYGTLIVDIHDESTQSIAQVLSTNAVDLGALVGSWHHLAVTYDGRGGAAAADGINVYIDGTAIPLWRWTQANYVAMENLATPLEIGHAGDLQDQYDGSVDEVRLWNVARSAAAIQGTMNAELAGTETGLVAYWRFNTGLGTTAVDDSPANHTATLLAGTAWMADGPLAPDTTAPQILGVTVANITSAGATITFTTDESATAWVSYVAGTTCPCTDVYSVGTTTHSVTLTGLAGDTQYRFFVHARDAANNERATTGQTFRTLVPAPDTQAPVVTFVTPTAGAVAGTTAIQVNATDAVGVVSVQYKLDGVALGSPVTVAPYTLNWNTTTASEGAHTLTAEARDAANNVGTASVAVTVMNVTTPHYVELDGVDDSVRVADAPALSFGNGTTDTPFTMEMWLRPDTLAGRSQLLGKSGEYRVAILYGTLVVELRDESTGAIAQVLSTNAVDLGALVGSWHHLAVTYDGRGGAAAANGLAVYLDGTAIPLWTWSNGTYVAMENLANSLEIGHAGDFQDQYDGGLDELRIWNVARTAAQIQAARNGELTGNETGLVAYWRFNTGLGTTVVDDSPASHTATLLGGTAWVADGPLAPDTTAPLIGAVTVSNVTSSAATITFTTNEAATAWASYVAGTACPCTDVYSVGTTAHSVTLTGLTADTQYRFVLHARDSANNERIAAAQTFRTLVPTPDTLAPTVAIVSPTTDPISGSVSITATASDNNGVASVLYKLDGVALGAAVTTAPYTFVWNTTTASEGSHTLTAEARDAANNLGTAAVTVLVQNTTTPHFLELDGVNDAVRIADAPALSFGTGTADAAFTMEMWLRPDALSARHQLLGKAGEYRIAVLYGTLVVDIRDESTGAIAQVLTTNAVDLSPLVGSWHHLAVTYDGRGGAAAADGLTIYIDGVAVALWRWTAAGYVAMENLTAPIEIGHASDLQDQYDGAIDELRLWNVARTAAQIQAAMNTELAGNETGLVAYWRFNAGGGTNAGDDSPAPYVATLLSGTAWGAGGPFQN